MSAAQHHRPKPKENRQPSLSNRRAYHEYEVMDSLEVGIALSGTEIKAIRAGKASIGEAHARILNGQVWLYGMNVSPYEAGTYNNHEPLRHRQLLLHKKEILKLAQQTAEKGLTLIPLRLYFKRCWVKLELGVCRGKKLHDKREAIAAKDAKRDMDRIIKQHRNV